MDGLNLLKIKSFQGEKYIVHRKVGDLGGSILLTSALPVKSLNHKEPGKTEAPVGCSQRKAEEALTAPLQRRPENSFNSHQKDAYMRECLGDRGRVRPKTKGI